MPFDENEVQRRKEQRIARQQQRLRQRRRTLIGLVVAALILLACGVLIVTVKPPAPGGEQTDPVQTQPVQTQDPSDPSQVPPATSDPTGTTADSSTVIHIVAAGDLNVTQKVINSGGMGYDYTEVFMDVLPLLSQADLTVLNFEGTMNGDRDSAPRQLGDALRRAGVDVVQLANSMSISKGISGLRTTLDNIRSTGLEPLGAYATTEEFRKSGGYTICNVKGVKVALVAFTKGMSGMALPAGCENCVNLLYTDYSGAYQKVDTEGITRILENVAKEKPDITVALVHWGSEYNEIHSNTQEKIRKLLLQQGVDAIIGTHPHLVQELVMDPQTGAFTAYSLGDFISDADRAGTEYSIVLDLEITRDNTTGLTTITNYSYTPIFTAELEDGTLRVVRLREAIAAYEAKYIERFSQETYNKMVYALSRVEERVKPKETQSGD